MFEMTLSTIKARNKDISFIINKLRPVVKNINGIMVCEEFDGRVKLAIAAHENKKDYLFSLAIDAVCEAIIRGYKEDYLKKHLKIKFLGRVALATFIKALTMFDKQGDKDIIKKQLTPFSELNIDSFYNFRLWELEKRWKDICLLVSENSSHLLVSGSFQELMKFLISTNEPEIDEVLVHRKNGKIVFEEKDGKELAKFSYKNDDNDKISVLSELISFAPEKIIVFGGEVGDELSELIISLFDGKVTNRK